VLSTSGAEKTHAAPAGIKPGPPTRAVLPALESATLEPNLAWPAVSFAPCCFQADPVRVNSHAELSPGSPIRAVLPALDSATLEPNSAKLQHWSLGTSFEPCCAHVEPKRTNTHAAPVASPARELSKGPPITAVSPPLDSAMLQPNEAAPNSPPLVRIGPWVHVDPVRVNTPTSPLYSRLPAIRAAPPSPDRATL
jgi:hypothetical protein